MSSGTEVAFTTSGHSGPPARWSRTDAQLEAEVEIVTNEGLGLVEQVVTFAPTAHLFGRLYGELLPRMRDVPVHHVTPERLDLSTLDVRRRTLFVCLPMSWLALRSLVPMLSRLDHPVVLHGTGPVVPATHDVVRALTGTGFRAVEIFGSTETGAVASRPITAEPSDSMAWTVFSDVELVVDRPVAEQPLVVRGPRLARREDMATPPTSWRLDDVVRVLDPRRFELVGRESGLIKVNGRRCDLTAVERILRERHPEADFACLSVPDTIGGEHYEVFVTDAELVGGVDRVWTGLADALDPLPVPRRIHRIGHIPRSATGKVRTQRLRTLVSGGGS